MRTREDLLTALASASSLKEQISLAAELDAVDVALRTTAAAERSLDWADTVVRSTLSPVAVHEHHTAATDWLGEADTTGGDNHHQAVIAEAAVWFQRLDDDVKADAHEFTQQAQGIARRTAGKYGEAAEVAERSFLDYVAFLNRTHLAASGLPQIDQLVDSQENPAQTPMPLDVFDTFQEPIHPINQGVSGTEQNSMGPGAEMAMSENGGGNVGRPSEHDEGGEAVAESPNEPRSAEASLDGPSVAIGYRYNMDDFLAAEAAREAGGAAPFVREPEPRRAEAASGLDQVQQTMDSEENPKPTSLPEDVMFPIVQAWPEESTQAGAEDEPKTASRKTADTWQGGDAPARVPGGETPVANSPATTPPRANGGSFDKGVTEGRADAAAGEAPSFADNSSMTSDYVRGYVQGFGEGQAPQGVQDVPSAMGGDNGQAQNAAEVAARTEKPLVMAKAERGMTVSASLLTADVTQDADFQLGYRYASTWQPGGEIVALGSQGEEAGIYAGITDNPGAQKAWMQEHLKLAKKHPELRVRLKAHRLVTTSHRQAHPDAIIRGLYVQAASSLDLDTMGPGTSPDPQGATPFEGPGTVPELRDVPGTPAAAGGASPYNGAEPFGAPVVEDPLMQETQVSAPASPDAVHMTGDSSITKSPQSLAFRRKVQEAKLALRQKGTN